MAELLRTVCVSCLCHLRILCDHFSACWIRALYRLQHKPHLWKIVRIFNWILPDLLWIEYYTHTQHTHFYIPTDWRVEQVLRIKMEVALPFRKSWQTDGRRTDQKTDVQEGSEHKAMLYQLSWKYLRFGWEKKPSEFLELKKKGLKTPI